VNNKAVKNQDGSISTIRSITVTFDGIPTLIPTVWDGRILSDDEAIERAIASGIDWPTFKTIEEANTEAARVSKMMAQELK
jgi:hypothetical protein